MAIACESGDNASCKEGHILSVRSDIRDAQLLACKGVASDACETLFSEARQAFSEISREGPYSPTSSYQKESDLTFDIAHGWDGVRTDGAGQQYQGTNDSVIRPIGTLEGLLTFNQVGVFTKGVGEGIYSIVRLPWDVSVGMGNLYQDAFGYGAQSVFGSPGDMTGQARPYSAKNGIVQSFVNNGAVESIGGFIHDTTMAVSGASLLNSMYRKDWGAVGAALPSTLMIFAGGTTAQTVASTNVTRALNTEVISTAQSSRLADLLPETSLSRKQIDIHTQLSEPGTFATIPKSLVSMKDLRAIGEVTGDEYNMFTKGGERLVIRGEGSNIRVSPEMYEDLLDGKYGKFSGHTHPPGYSIEPGPADRPFLRMMQQERSAIWGSDGFRIFGPVGPADDARILSEINRANMINLYGG